MGTTKRVIENTWKQIQRSGWIAWSSIAVMSVAFLVGTVFGGLALLLEHYIQFIETRDNMLVFFEVGTDPDLISDLQQKWSGLSQIKGISYTDEEQAYEDYFDATIGVDPINNAALAAQEEKKLDSSLEIRLNSLNDVYEVADLIQQDIDSELVNLQYDVTEPPIRLSYDDENIDRLIETFSTIRYLTIGLMSLLFIIIFFFILMTVEYRTYNRMEEIGVMQLVGGSLSYIRAPYVLEGGVYGAIGAAVSSAIIGVVWWVLFDYNADGAFAQQVTEWTRSIALPTLSFLEILSVFGVMVLMGGVLGGLISYIAIRRYIK